MERKLLGIVVIGVALLATSPDALAHKKHRHGQNAHHDNYAYDDYYSYERRRLPRWLKRHDHFRAWYRHTPLRHNPRLNWDELYSIYRWERRYSAQRRFHRYGKRAHRDHGYRDHAYRDFRYYRKYWKKHRRDRDRRYYRH